MARIVEVSWQKFIFKPICLHVKVHFVMAVSYILQYHNKIQKLVNYVLNMSQLWLYTCGTSLTFLGCDVQLFCDLLIIWHILVDIVKSDYS